jgi:Tfp pilus assembly protein PilN
MIKINLLPQKRPRRQVGRRGAVGDPSTKQLLYGVASLVAAALAVVFLLDLPMRSRVAKYERDAEALRAEITKQNEDLTGFAEMQKAQVDAQARKLSIERLMRAKVVPAHVLHELGEILTTNRQPTVSQDMADRMKIDPNKRFQQDWDPTHVWLSGFSDNNGVFKLEGGAQSESDVTQLSKRLAASVHFMDVTPAGGERVTDQVSGVNYYKFTITGRVAY